MNILLANIIITICIVYIWDVVEFPQSLLSQLLHIRVTVLRKPWGCSLCMTTWITLIMFLIFNWKLAPVALLLGWSTKYIHYTFNLVDRILTKIFIWLEYPFTK